jgi:hypothetical protein
MALFHKFGVNHAAALWTCGIACLAHSRVSPRDAADFLELAENGLFQDRKLIIAFNETLDMHYVGWVRRTQLFNPIAPHPPNQRA